MLPRNHSRLDRTKWEWSFWGTLAMSTKGQRPFKFAGRLIGHGNPPLIVAEMSGNHNGDINRALALIDAAKAAGADAVKLQTYTADTITLDHDGPQFRVTGGTLWDGQTLYNLYQQAHTPWDWHPTLFAHARKIGIEVFSSRFNSSTSPLPMKRN